jgi:hypothetical protein
MALKTKNSNFHVSQYHHHSCWSTFTIGHELYHLFIQRVGSKCAKPERFDKRSRRMKMPIFFKPCTVLEEQESSNKYRKELAWGGNIIVTIIKLEQYFGFPRTALFDTFGQIGLLR